MMAKIETFDGQLDPENLAKVIDIAEISNQYSVLHAAGHDGKSSEGYTFYKYSWPVYTRGQHDEIPSCFKELWEDVQKHLNFEHSLHRIYVNAHTFGVEDSIHVDDVDLKKGKTAIVYLCRGWNAEWAGPTTFYSGGKDPMVQDIAHSVLPRPNRLVIFDKEIPHSVSPLSRRCTDVRLTCMFKIEDLS